MSYYENAPGERGLQTEQYRNERTGYHTMGGAAPLRTPMPRLSVQQTVPLVGQRVIRRPSTLILPPGRLQETAPRPARYRGIPRARALSPQQRLQVNATPRVGPRPRIVQPIPPPPVPGPSTDPYPTAPPLPDDLDYADPWNSGVGDAGDNGNEDLEELELEAAETSAPSPFPWKTVGVVAAVGVGLYLLGRKR